VDQLPLVSHLRIYGNSLVSFSYIIEQSKALNSVSQSSPTNVFLLSRVTHREYCEVLSFPILTQCHARVSIYPCMVSFYPRMEKLSGTHRFSDCNDMKTIMRDGVLSAEDQKILNSRVINENEVKKPKPLETKYAIFYKVKRSETMQMCFEITGRHTIT
jgi:hypothetical protein